MGTRLRRFDANPLVKEASELTSRRRIPKLSLAGNSHSSNGT